MSNQFTYQKKPIQNGSVNENTSYARTELFNHHHFPKTGINHVQPVEILGEITRY